MPAPGTEPPGGQSGNVQPPSAGPIAPQRRGYQYGDAYGPFLRPTHQAQVSQFLSTLHRYELTARKHWWIVILALVAALAPATYHIYTTPPSYASTGKLWMSGKLNLKDNQLYSEELGTFMGTQVGLLKSTTLYDRALAAVYEARPEWIHAPWNTNGNPRPFTLEVKELPKAVIIELKASGPEADPVKAFLDSLMEEYQTYRKQIRVQSSDVTLTSISDQVKTLEADLARKQDAIREFMASNNVVLLQEQGNSAGAYVARLNRQLAGLRTEYQTLQLLTPEQLAESAPRERQPGDEAGPSDDSARQLLLTMSGPRADFFKAAQQIEVLKAQRQELATFLRPTHPKMLKFDEDLARQQQVVEVFRRQSQAQMQSRVEALEIQMAGLEKSIAEWEAKAIDASRLMAIHERLRQDAQRTQNLYDRLVGVIQSVDVNRTLDQESIRVMEQASAPKEVRETRKFLALGVLAGLGLGFGLIYILNLFDDRFSAISELRNHLSELVVGQIPEVRLPRGHPTVDLIREEDDRHTFAESFRNIRSWFLFSFRDKGRPRTILLTSAQPSEGKSTIAANLAATLALSGSRVLLVDGDLRRAGLHARFQCENAPGFAEILEQETRIEEAVVATTVRNLSFLPAGEAGVNPGELFLAPSMDTFLTRVRDRYDYIIFDSAPIMATDDTSNMAPKIDGVLFVVRADYTSARLARESLALLRQRQVNVLGLVFNRSLPTRSQGQYYYRYSDYYYYKKQPGGGHTKKKRHRPETASTAAAEPTAPPPTGPVTG